MTGDCANNNCIGSSLEARSDGRYTAVVTVGTNELLISSSSKALLSAAKDVLEDFLSQQHTKECLKKSNVKFLCTFSDPCWFYLRIPDPASCLNE
jgi:hypothetical protein